MQQSAVYKALQHNQLLGCRAWTARNCKQSQVCL